MHKYWYNLKVMAPPDLPMGQGGNGGGNSQGGNNNQGGNGNNGGNNNGGQNGGTQEKTGLAKFEDMWQAPKKPGDQGGGNSGGNNGDNGGGQGGNNNNNGNGNQQQQGASKTDLYLAKNDYFKGANAEALTKAFQSQDVAAFTEAMSGVLRNMHKTLLGEMDTFGEHYRDEAVKSATNKAGADYRTQQLYEQMFTTHPALKLPAVKPVAQMMLGKFMETPGMDSTKAINQVMDYFKAVGTEFNKPPGNPGGRGDGGTGNSGDGDGSREIDFNSIFGDPKPA